MGARKIAREVVIEMYGQGKNSAQIQDYFKSIGIEVTRSAISLVIARARKKKDVVRHQAAVVNITKGDKISAALGRGLELLQKALDGFNEKELTEGKLKDRLAILKTLGDVVAKLNPIDRLERDLTTENVGDIDKIATLIQAARTKYLGDLKDYQHSTGQLADYPEDPKEDVVE